MTTATFSCTIHSSDPAAKIAAEVWIDDQCLFESDHVSDHLVLIKFDNTEGQHELQLVMKNKQATDTKIDESGVIVSDAVLEWRNIKFDGIKYDYPVQSLSRYYHDFNGTGAPTVEQFYGTTGCNGSVKLKFTTPLYKWMLSNM